MIRSKLFIPLLFVISLIGCTSNSDSDNEEEAVECFTKASMESFEMKSGECVIISENPDMKLVLVGFKNHTKSNNGDYETIVTVRLEKTNFTWETPHEIYDDPNNDSIKFTGEIRTGINDDSYTIYVDNIEFTETETEIIFHKAMIRVQYTNS